MPHAVCWAAAPGLVWTMVVTNFITFLSYLSICLTLLYLGRRTGKVIARDWVFFVVGFALFIVACGSTHLLEVITTWNPIFWVDAWTNIITALLSGYIAIQLIRRATVIGFGINDYANRLANAENEKRAMEEALLASQKLEDWSRMSAVVAHEIANPLEAVHNLLYLIRSQEGVSPEIVRYAATAEEEATRVLTLSRSALSFFRQSAHPEPTDLLADAESVRAVLATRFEEQQAALKISASGNLTVEALAGESRQVLLNLIRNAGEASTRSGSEVVVRLTGHADFVEIVVADHGTGMPQDLLANLFQFGKTTKGERGNGMGLWTVKQILDRHHASVRVESMVGRGTAFTIQWPRAFASAQNESQLARALG
jgi:signal transduction histidine kinase